MASQLKTISRFACLIATGITTALLAMQAATAQEANEASSSRKEREQALRAIPFQNLTRATQAKLSPILKKPSFYRKMPVETIRCDHGMHTFLIRKPEVIVGIWKLMGITQVNAKRTAEFELEASDGVGTNSKLELIYGTPNLHIYYGEGEYEGPMIRSKVSGKCVIVLQSNMHHDQAGTPLVTDRMDVFLQIDNLGARMLTKTLHPLVSKAADHNFVETARFLTRISDASASNPAGVQNMARRLPDCGQLVRDQFSTVIDNAAALSRNASVAQQQLPRAASAAQIQTK